MDDERRKSTEKARCSWRRQTSQPVLPPGELDETYASSLILAYSLHDVTRKTESTWHIALPSEEDRATAKGNMYRKFGEIRTCVF